MWVLRSTLKNTDLAMCHVRKCCGALTKILPAAFDCIQTFADDVVESTQIVTNFRNAADSTESFHESNQRATWSMSLF